MRHRLLPTVAAPASAVVALLASCSGSSVEQPPVTAFHAGPCRSAAPAVLDIGKTIHAVTTKDSTPKDSAAQLTTSQNKLVPVVAGAQGATKTTLQDLVTAIGFYRIGVVSNTAGDPQLKNLQHAESSVLAFCTGSGTPTPGTSTAS